MRDDPDGLIIEARFVPVDEAIDLVLAGGVFPGSQSTADYLRGGGSAEPTFWLWDLNKSTDGPLTQLPGSYAGVYRREVNRGGSGGPTSS